MMTEQAVPALHLFLFPDCIFLRECIIPFPQDIIYTNIKKAVMTYISFGTSASVELRSIQLDK